MKNFTKLVKVWLNRLFNFFFQDSNYYKCSKCGKIFHYSEGGTILLKEKHCIDCS